MPKRPSPARRSLALAAAALAMGSVAPAPQSLAPLPAAEASVAATQPTRRDAPPPPARAFAQALDVAFTGRSVERYYRRHEPIWIGYERPRRSWS